MVKSITLLNTNQGHASIYNIFYVTSVIIIYCQFRKISRSSVERKVSSDFMSKGWVRWDLWVVEQSPGMLCSWSCFCCTAGESSQTPGLRPRIPSESCSICFIWISNRTEGCRGRFWSEWTTQVCHDLSLFFLCLLMTPWWVCVGRFFVLRW